VTRESLLHIVEDGLNFLKTVDFFDNTLVLESLDDWELLSLVLSQTLSKCFHVVIGAARACTSFLYALDKGILFNDEVKDSCDIDLVTHNLIPARVVIVVAGEPIDQEFAFSPPMSVHGFLDEAAGDRDWHNFTLLDDLVNKLCLFGPTSHFSSEQIASREMHESTILNQFGALSSLAGSWTPENEKDCRFCLSCSSSV